jgi:hypothetical protein
LKEKDAWDIYFCIRNYPGGISALIEAFQPYLEYQLVQEGLKNIAEKFSSSAAVGPKYVADFAEEVDEEVRHMLLRDAYERIRSLVLGLGVN